MDNNTERIFVWIIHRARYVFKTKFENCGYFSTHEISLARTH